MICRLIVLCCTMPASQPRDPSLPCVCRISVTIASASSEARYPLLYLIIYLHTIHQLPPFFFDQDQFSFNQFNHSTSLLSSTTLFTTYHTSMLPSDEPRGIDIVTKQSQELNDLAATFKEHSVENVLEISYLGDEISKWGALPGSPQTLIPLLCSFLSRTNEVMMSSMHVSCFGDLQALCILLFIACIQSYPSSSYLTFLPILILVPCTPHVVSCS